MTSIIFRFAERGDGAAGGPTKSGSPLVDLANICLTFKLISPMHFARQS